MGAWYADAAAADLAPELERHLALADAELDAAVAAAPDAALVVRHLDRAARHARAGFGRTAAMWSVHPDAGLREAASEAQTRFEGWRSATLARRDLADPLAAVDERGLDPADAGCLRTWRTVSRANGAHLDDAGREGLTALHARASALAMAASAAFVDDVPVLELSTEELAGLSADDLAALEEGSRPGTRRVLVDYANQAPVLEGVARRDVRERFWRALQDRGRIPAGDAMRELFGVRREIARLTGFGSWADIRTATGALRSVEAAQAMLEELAGPASAAGSAFLEAARAVLADELDGAPLEPWDIARAQRRLTERLGGDDVALREYLPVDTVAAGMFRLVETVFGVRVVEREGGQGWHPDVRTLELSDAATGELIGTCLWDPWAREGKMAGTLAFMDLLRADPPGPDGVRPPALTMLVTMLRRVPGAATATMSVYEAGVLFHEFGHVLDFTIGSRRGATLEDAWGGMDWAEGPSFFLEYWSLLPEVFATYARHPVTGEPAPAELVERLAIAQAISDISYLAKYIRLGLFDLAAHGPVDVDLDEAWRTAHASMPFPEPLGGFRPFPVSMVAGGYDAALYGVPFALAIRDDLLARMAMDGLLDPAAGRRYIDTVLRPGPFVPPVERLAAFLGRPVSSAPLVARLRRAVEAARQATG